MAKEGENVYQELKAKYTSASAVGNGAVGSWVLGKQGVALYVMSKACQDDPADGDNLNNFAAMLTMSGGEQYALPLLLKLDATYPGNSTITSNIGQAWFGLGDMEKASKYIDKALALCPAHTQANLVKARLELNEGNREAAIEAIKRSIKEAYSSEKEDALDKLGYKLKSEDLTWDRPFIRDGLGLNRFKWPAYPKNVVESEVLETRMGIIQGKMPGKNCRTRIATRETGTATGDSLQGKDGQCAGCKSDGHLCIALPGNGT